MKNYILTITPSPALDLGGIVDNLRPNEKSYVHDETKSPGGNAINAARILTRLNIPVLATGFLGGSTGVEIKTLLDGEKVPNKFMKISGHSRICVTVSNKTDNKQTRLNFPGPKITHQEKINLFRMLENQKNISLIVFGGSLPEGFHVRDILRLMNLARKNNIECIIDSPGNILRELIDAKPLLIKPNLIEFQELTESRVKSIHAVKKKAQKLLDKVPYICISSVEGGALLVTRNYSYFGRIPDVKVKSTVGAGDSMVGAMAAQFYKNNLSGEDILKWGLGAAAATLSMRGTELGHTKAIHQLYKRTTVSVIK